MRLDKDAHYRTCVYLNADGQDNVENRLKNAIGSLAPATDILALKDSKTDDFVLRWSTKKKGICLHFVTYQPGARAAVVKLTNSGAGMSISENKLRARDTEYIRSQLFVYVKENGLLYVTHNNVLRNSGVQSLLQAVLIAAGMYDDQSSFVLIREGNKDNIKAIAENGIEYIDLKLGVLEDALEYFNKNGDVAQGPFKSIFGKDGSLKDDEALADMKASLIIKTSRRWKKDGVKVAASILAEDISETHDDGYKIKLKNGGSITENNMTVSSRINVKGNAQILSRKSVFKKLKKGYEDLEASSALDV